MRFEDEGVSWAGASCGWTWRPHFFLSSPHVMPGGCGAWDVVPGTAAQWFALRPGTSHHTCASPLIIPTFMPLARPTSSIFQSGLKFATSRRLPDLPVKPASSADCYSSTTELPLPRNHLRKTLERPLIKYFCSFTFALFFLPFVFRGNPHLLLPRSFASDQFLCPLAVPFSVFPACCL